MPEWHDTALWRLVIAKMGTLHEIETEWSIDDYVSAHLALDLREDTEILVDGRLR